MCFGNRLVRDVSSVGRTTRPGPVHKTARVKHSCRGVFALACYAAWRVGCVLRCARVCVSCYVLPCTFYSPFLRSFLQVLFLVRTQKLQEAKKYKVIEGRVGVGEEIWMGAKGGGGERTGMGHTQIEHTTTRKNLRWNKLVPKFNHSSKTRMSRKRRRRSRKGRIISRRKRIGARTYRAGPSVAGSRHIVSRKDFVSEGSCVMIVNALIEPRC